VLAIWLKKKRSFPWHFTIFAAVAAGFSFVDEIVASAFRTGASTTAQGLASSARAIIFASVWITYLHRSKRVAETFVT